MAEAKKPAKKAAAKKADAKAPSQSEMAKKLLEKVQAKSKGGVPGAAVNKGGFDPKSVRGGKGSLGGAHGQMLRRTQGKGGGGGGGGGGGQV
jgi:hypothetical protein